VGVDRIHDEAALYGDEAAQTAVAALELLANQSVTDAIEAGAAVTRQRRTEQSEVCDLGNQLSGEAVLLKAFADNRQHALVDETCDRFADDQLVTIQQPADVQKVGGIQAHHAPSKTQLRRGFGDIPKGSR